MDRGDYKDIELQALCYIDIKDKNVFEVLLVILRSKHRQEIIY